MKVEQVLQNITDYQQVLKSKNSKSFEKYFHDFKVIEVQTNKELFKFENGVPEKIEGDVIDQ